MESGRLQVRVLLQEQELELLHPLLLLELLLLELLLVQQGRLLLHGLRGLGQGVRRDGGRQPGSGSGNSSSSGSRSELLLFHPARHGHGR